MPKKDEEIILTFRLPQSQIAALDRIAEDEDRSRANILRRLVADYLESQKKKR